MPRSCPPLRSDEVGWHGRRVRTRLRLILERVFWFVNGGMSGGVGGDGGYVRIHAPHLDSGPRGACLISVRGLWPGVSASVEDLIRSLRHRTRVTHVGSVETCPEVLGRPDSALRFVCELGRRLGPPYTPQGAQVEGCGRRDHSAATFV